MDRKITDYTLVIGEPASMGEMMKTIQELIEHGWQPFGGVSVSTSLSGLPGHPPKTSYAQAMVIYKA